MFHASTFILSLFIHSSICIYTNEVPVKFLQVEALADRYPATNSSYRTSVTNGVVSVWYLLWESNAGLKYGFVFKDEDAHRTEGEELNGFPKDRLILSPGGCAEYVLPVKADQNFAIIHPARKTTEGPYEDYCPKALINVAVLLPYNNFLSLWFTFS